MQCKRMIQTVLAAAAIIASPTAEAQFYNGGCSSCGPQRIVSAPINCAPVQALQTSCYETVPVTTFRKVRQTVQVPEYVDSWETRKVTRLVPVTTKREVEVPTVSYQTVMENRTVNRDMGRWQTNYQPVSKCTPCQYDPRPGLIGWLNRSMVGMRNSMTPSYRTTRQYIPRMVTCNVPTARQVAVRGTRKVVLHETKMVAKEETERVKVSKVVMRDKVVTVMKPQVAYQTVPMGSRLALGGFGNSAVAYGYGGYYPGALVFEEDGESRTALDPEVDDEVPRSAERPRAFPEDSPTEFRRQSQRDEDLHRASRTQQLPPATDTNMPQFEEPGFKQFGPQGRRDSRADSEYLTVQSRKPSRRRGWKAVDEPSAEATADVKPIELPGMASR